MTTSCFLCAGLSDHFEAFPEDHDEPCPVCGYVNPEHDCGHPDCPVAQPEVGIQ